MKKIILVTLLVLGGGLSGIIIVNTVASENNYGIDRSSQHSSAEAILFVVVTYSSAGFLIGSSSMFILFKILKDVSTKAQYFVYGAITFVMVVLVADSSYKFFDPPALYRSPPREPEKEMEVIYDTVINRDLLKRLKP